MALAFASSACATAPNGACGDLETAGATLEAIIAADNARDLERVMTYYTDDIVWRPPAPREPMRGIAAIRESYEHMYTAHNPNLSGTVESTRAVGRDVMVSGRTRGVLRPQMTEVADVYVNDAYTAMLRCAAGRWRVAELTWRPAN